MRKVKLSKDSSESRALLHEGLNIVMKMMVQPERKIDHFRAF